MRRFTPILCAIAAIALSVTARAQSNLIWAADPTPSTEAQAQVKVKAPASVNYTAETPSQWGELKALDASSLMPTGPVKPQAEKPIRRLLGKPLPQYRAEALGGYYVGTYSTLVQSSYDGGSMMRIVQDSFSDSITIQGFWSGASLRGRYSVLKNSITIHSQIIGVDPNVGPLAWAVVNPDGTPNYSATITSKVNVDGSIDLSDAWWGIFITEGTNKDKFVAAYTDLVLTPPNGTMQSTRNGATAEDPLVENAYGVLIEQPVGNMLRVTNFFNRGLTIEINLNRDRTTSIDNQVALKNSNGSYVIIQCTEFNEAGNLTKYSPILTTKAAAADNNTVLEWTNWSLLCAEARSYAGNYLTGRLTASTPWSYPTLSVNGFEGEGTEENPYLITCRDHLILLADKVNQDTAYVGKWFSWPCTRTYLGKHFALANDIDMEGYRTEAIGSSFIKHFAGSLDGRGHTIKNLAVKGGNDKYAGLFGMCDTLTVLKNIRFENPVIESDYNYAGVVAANNLGNTENITVINPTVTNQRYGAGGVVAIAGGAVKNCHVIDGLVVAGGYVAGITGECKGGIENCSVTGTRVYIIGTSGPAAGVVGNLLDKDGTNLSFSGLLSYSNNGEAMDMGGVAGWVQNVTLSNSFSSGVVNGYSNDSRVGGVVGVLRGHVENCYSSGLIHCYSRKCAGIVGQIMNRPDFSTSGINPSVKNCYTSAVIESETYMYDTNDTQEVIGKATTLETVTPVVENVYFDANITNYGSKLYGSNTAALTAAQGPAGFSADVWTFLEGAYPRIKSMADTESSLFSASAINFTGIDNLKKVCNNTKVTALGNTKFLFSKGKELTTTGHYGTIENDSIKLNGQFGRDTLYIVNGTVQTYRVINLAPLPFEGEGTAESPLLIKTKDDLIKLAEATTVKGQTFTGVHFLLTSDIDLELDPAFVGISTKAADTYNRFNGVFDGGGHTIHRMLIPDRVAWTTPSTESKKGTLNTSKCQGWSGFIGRLDKQGVLRNLNIAADSKLEMYATCAALVGANYGLVENCRNYADVLAYSCWVGGICGKTEEGGVVRNCYNAGNITTCYSGVGGIVGTSYGTVENCANTGDIKSVSYITNYATNVNQAGGIVGGSTSGLVMRNCINTGTVRASKDKVGGLLGYNSSVMSDGIDRDTIVSSLNLGLAINGDKATLGAITGNVVSKNYANVYYDRQLLALKAGNNKPVNGVIAASTATLTSGQPVEGLSAELWDYQPGQYPVLKQFADEPRLAAARKVMVKAADDEASLADLHTSIQLGDGATWSLKNNNPAFTLQGNTLTAPATVSTVESDSLIALDAAGVAHLFAVNSLPFNPLKGDGTAENPYLVNNVEDWNALSQFMDATLNTLDGEFIKLTADLDFTDAATTARFGTLAAVPFSAILDGDNHTIKGLQLDYKANQNGALFGTITATGTVKNLTLEGNVSSSFSYATSLVDKLYGTLENIIDRVNVGSTKTNAAGVAGYAYGGSVLRNVTYSGTVATNSTSMAGIVNTTNGGLVTFENVTFAGTLQTTVAHTKATVAAIGGMVYNATNACTFTNCTSRGTITVKTPAFSTTLAGFIANVGGAAGAKFTFTNCVNETPLTGAGILGGFVAKGPSTAANAQYILTDCVNRADISAVSTTAVSSAPTAGLIATYHPGSQFIRCGNEGTISSEKNVYTAGIAGTNNGTPSEAAGTVEFTDCYNTGAILAYGNQGAGICGYVAGATTLTNCYNTADIEGNQMVAGICSGFSGTGPKMINCYNTGNITAAQQRAAGLIAWGGPTGGLVENCWNSGDITSTSTEQSTKVTAANEIGGLAGANDATFRNCYNVGRVTGQSRVGGLVGNPTKGKTAFYNCYNAGTIIAPADSCGSIVGVSMVNNGTRWNDANVIENTYYLTDNTCNADSAIAATAGITRRQLAALDLGEAFTSPDDYTHPVLRAFADHATALFHAAELILHQEDTPEAVTHSTFNLGGGSHVTWTTDCPAITIEGNTATFVKDHNGPVKVTATAGERTKAYTLTANVLASGIDNIQSGDILSVRYFTPAGVEVHPSEHDGKLYIRVTRYTNGTSRVDKHINK